MRHFLSVDASGAIIGMATRGGGFTDDHNLDDPSCMHPEALNHRKLSARDPRFDRFVEYVCPCTSEELNCTCECPRDRASDHYADGSALVAKPALTVLIDGASVGDPIGSTPHSRPTGSAVSLKLLADVPDGHQVIVRTSRSAAIIREETMLTFSGGETGSLELKAPANGVTGLVAGASKYVRPFKVMVQGWE